MPPDHDVVEVGDDKVGVAQMNINCQSGQEQAGHTSNGEQSDEAQRIQHRRVVGDRGFVKRCRPVEDLDCGRNRHGETQEREDHAGIERLAGDKQMVTPDQKTEHGNGQARKSDEGITEDIFAREVCDQLTDHAHAGQDHDVDRRMGVEPEEMLKQDRIAPSSGIKNADMRQPFEGQQQNRDRDYRRAQNHDQAGGVMGPDKKRQTKPGHARCAHSVNRNDKIEARQN